jgi:hypothetical protein
MPALVALLDSCTGYWQKSHEHLWTVRKQLGYLLLMVIVLPLTGLTSLIVEAIISESKGIPAFNWGCIYIPDEGAFYITGTFIGAAVKLLQIPEHLIYLAKICICRSKAEVESVRAKAASEFGFGNNLSEFGLGNNLSEFGFGNNLSRMLFIFGATIIFTPLFPVITPRGFVLFLVNYGG